jgi:hypothetical protein
MPTEDFDRIDVSAHATIRNMYNYKNSARGMLSMLNADYDALNLDATAIQQKLADPNHMDLLKDVLAKLG